MYNSLYAKRGIFKNVISFISPNFYYQLMKIYKIGNYEEMTQWINALRSIKMTHKIFRECDSNIWNDQLSTIIDDLKYRININYAKRLSEKDQLKLQKIRDNIFVFIYDYFNKNHPEVEIVYYDTCEIYICLDNIKNDNKLDFMMNHSDMISRYMDTALKLYSEQEKLDTVINFEYESLIKTMLIDKPKYYLCHELKKYNVEQEAIYIRGFADKRYEFTRYVINTLFLELSNTGNISNKTIETLEHESSHREDHDKIWKKKIVDRIIDPLLDIIKTNRN